MSFYGFARAVTGIYAKLFYRAEYHGRENEPEGGRIIVLSNHSSFTDPIFTSNAIKRELTFIARSSLEKHFLLRSILRACHIIPIKRGESDIQALRIVCAALEEEKSLGIYPQGTRMPGVKPEPEQAMAGIGLMASRGKATLLPVAICCGKNKKGKPCIFRKVRVYVGRPITYEEYSSINERPNSHEIARYAFSKVCELFEEHNGE